MQYNLKLYSSIGMSDDFSKKFTQNEFSANKNLVLRVNGHRNHSLYKYLLKMSSGEIVVEDCGELKEHEFYDIVKKNTPFIAQRILERKVNQKNNSKESEETIEYLSKTENYFAQKNPKKKKISDFFKEIYENDEIKELDQIKMFEEITVVKEKTEDIIKNAKIEEIQDEKENLKDQITKYFPKINEEIEKLRYDSKNLNENNNNSKNNIILNEEETTINDKIKLTLEQSNTNYLFSNENKISEIPMPSKIILNFETEKEKYNNFISEQDFSIIKENFDTGYHEIISLKNIPYDASKKIQSLETIPNSPDNFDFDSEKLEEYQKKSILCLENKENILISGNINEEKDVIIQYNLGMAKRDKKRVIYISIMEELCNQKYKNLKEIFDDVGLMTSFETRNEDASFIITSLEILRNMLFKRNKMIKEISYVIFDEVEHCMKNSETNTFFEESIILLNNKINFIFFSDIIPNTREFGMWITKLKKQQFNIIFTSLNTLELEHYIFPFGPSNSDLFEVLYLQKINYKENEVHFYNENYHKAFNMINYSLDASNTNQNFMQNPNIQLKNGINKLILILQKKKLFPAIFLFFSKLECEINAFALGQQLNKTKSKESSPKKTNKKGAKEKNIDFITKKKKKK